MDQILIGRDEELGVLERALDADTRTQLIFVHGPGGIGKTALLGELAARARARGIDVRSVDGRDPGPAVTMLEGELAPRPGGWSPLLLVVDTFEEAPALGDLIRQESGPALESGVRIVIAGRRPPEAVWSIGDWPERMLELPLQPLSAVDSRRLLAEGGVDGETGQAVAEWGGGHPLSLTVAADAVRAGADLDLDGLDEEELLATVLIRRLARDELEDADHDVLAVAAIAQAVDARMLAAVLPEVDGDRAETWLRSLSFAEPLGTRVTLHARMRAALATAVAARDPGHDQELRRRIADHLYARINLGEPRLVADRAELVTDPTLRWGLAPAKMTHRVMYARPGDHERVGELLAVSGQAWWEEGTRRWFDEAPERVAVIRDADGAISGWGITVTPATAPEWAHEDPVVGTWLADAAENQPDGNALMMRDGGELPVPEVTPVISPAISAGNYYVLIASGLRTISRSYAPVMNDDAQARQFLNAMGYDRAEHLDCREPDHAVDCYVSDWGPGGVYRAGRDLVYMSLGLPPPVPMVDEGNGSASVEDSVRDALRSFHDPVALASSPLALGATTDQRAETVRSLLRRSLSAAFGDSEDERLRRATIELGYIDPAVGHSRAIGALNVSRATYYRRLAEAAERLGAYVALEGGSTG